MCGDAVSAARSPATKCAVQSIITNRFTTSNRVGQLRAGGDCRLPLRALYSDPHRPWGLWAGLGKRVVEDFRQIIARDQAKAPFFVGVDLGGTNIKVGVVDDEGRTLLKRKQPTNSPAGPEDGARRMGQAVCDALAELGLKPDDVPRVGLGSPGTMDVPAGMLLEPHNLQGWFDFPIRDRVAEHSGFPVSFANDANAAAFGEYWVGAGSDYTSMVMLTLGTGIGCGIIIDDLLIDGENSHGAECGHIIIDLDDDARVCGCGQPGHLEAYCSAPHVVRRTEETLAGGRASTLRARIAAGQTLTPLMLAEEAESGDAVSREIVLETARFLGIGIVTLLHTIDPAGVVLGGAMTFGRNEAPLGRAFRERIEEEIRRRAFPVIAERIKLDYASLGGDAGYIGAAGIARRDWRKLANA